MASWRKAYRSVIDKKPPLRKKTALLNAQAELTKETEMRDRIVKEWQKKSGTHGLEKYAESRVRIDALKGLIGILKRERLRQEGEERGFLRKK